jgi:hypothetical protein
MTTTNFLSGLIVCFGLALIMFAVVVGVTKLFAPKDTVQERFAAVCAAAKGEPAWNGRHWECIK